jgi:hypothetical protein
MKKMLIGAAALVALATPALAESDSFPQVREACGVTKQTRATAPHHLTRYRLA